MVKSAAVSEDGSCGSRSAPNVVVAPLDVHDNLDRLDRRGGGMVSADASMFVSFVRIESRCFALLRAAGPENADEEPGQNNEIMRRVVKLVTKMRQQLCMTSTRDGRGSNATVQ